jgi:hypothetical protein
VILAVLFAHGTLGPAFARAGDPEKTAESADETASSQHPKKSTLDGLMKTMGGRQFWGT